jgi:serine/threonine protein kinase
MEILCTRPKCPRPQNNFAELDDRSILKSVQQKYCTACGMPLILGDRYMPSQLLGRGGFGAAFLARDRYTPKLRECVVKQFQPTGDLSLDQIKKAQALFEREAEVLEQLGTHPQIPDLYAFFELNVKNNTTDKPERFFYIVQELIKGENLEQEAEKIGTFSELQIIEVLRQILPVLQFVHENSSIHRDIKPSNIMRHQNGTLYLLDFGAVKNAAAGASTGTSTGIYSMGFAPPEQMTGGQVYPCTDLYALAVTCVQLLTGKQPIELFDTYNNQWIWANYVQLTPHLASILERMLKSAPNQRYESAQEVLQALENPIENSSNNQSNPIAVAPDPVPSVPNIPQPVLPDLPPIPQPVAARQAPAIARQPRFSILEVLSSGGFTGWAGGLLYISLSSLSLSTGIMAGCLGMGLAGLIFLQYKRWLEGKDLPILAAISFGIVALVPILHGSLSLGQIAAIAGLSATAAIAITALFRLIYQLLYRLL